MNTANHSASLFDSVLAQYELGEAWTVEQGEGGMNNTTRMVRTGPANAYMLRVYNNHRDESIVLLEHEILTALAASPLPLAVPVPVANRLGSTVTTAEDGRLAGLCAYIPGQRPSIANSLQLKSLGKAAAELMHASSGLRIRREPVYEPYFELESTYGSPSGDDFLRLAELSGKLASGRPLLERLREEYERCGLVCEAASKLPRQWIHGDLVLNNTVADGDDIIGLLDFEFTTVDARAMEIAVALMDIVQAKPEGDTLRRAAAFCEGFRSRMRLSDEEIGLLPELMKLRMLDVSLHFMSRFNDGLDGAEVLETIVIGAGEACEWVRSHGAELTRLLRGD